jgi:uncharacterized protein
MRDSLLKLLLMAILVTPVISFDIEKTEPVADVSDKLLPVPAGSVKIDGYLGNKIDLCINNRIKALDFDQFAEPFRHREETRLWQGEFFGKLMLGAISSYQYNKDPEMLSKISKAFKDLIATQTPDGYIGNYSANAQLQQWDIWCRKYTLLSLLSYNDLTGDKDALNAARKLADYTLSQVGPGKANIVKTGNYRGMPSSSILEPFVYLYKKTGEKKYLDFARYIVAQWETDDGPQLIGKGLKGIPVSERFPFPKTWWSYENGQKAYEMMSCYDGLLELYRITGEADYLKAVEMSVGDIIKSEINIAGSGSAFECWYHGAGYQTEPTYHMMETCVTFTWMKLCYNLLRITGDPLYADQIEKTAYNALLASLKGDGTQIAKYSPLEGTRSEGEKQCGMNINCCNANGPRGFMLLPQFAVMGGNNEIALNIYGNLSANVQVNPENRVMITVSSDYPADGTVEIKVSPERKAVFTLMVRIPSYTEKCVMTVNGDAVAATPGTYQKITREWNKGDIIKLKIGLTGRLITLKGYQAIVRGPVVLARDSRFKDRDVDEASVISNKNGVVDLSPVEKKPDGIWMAFTAPLVAGTNLEGEFRNPRPTGFCDFASAGNTWEEGSRYMVWIKEPMNVMKSDYRSY